MADLPGLLGRDFARSHSVELSYAGAGLLLFFLFLIATFPYTDALSAVLAPMGLRFSSREQGFDFPFGLKMDGVALSDSQVGSRPVFEGDQLLLRPAFLSMLLGSPGVHLKADAYGGWLAVTAHRRGDATSINFSLNGMHLERYRPPRPLLVELVGVVSGDGNGYVSGHDLNVDRGVLHLSAADASFRFAGIPLRIGAITATANLEGGKMNIQQLESQGGDVIVSGRGVIELEPNLPASTVAIRFQLQVTPAARTRLGFLLKFLPHPPNSAPYFLGGTVGRLTLS